jgi:hypothetical protein
MKTISLLLLFLSVRLYAVAGIGDVVYDPAAQADRNKMTLIQKAHHAFMEQKIVLQTKMIIQNYEEGKKHYDAMQKIREHKGGVVGYYKEKTVDRFKDTHTEFLGMVEKSMLSNATEEERKKVGEGWFLDKYAKDLDDYLLKKTDFTEEIDALFKKKEQSEKKEIEELSAEMETLDDLIQAKQKLDDDAAKLKTQNDYDQWNAKSSLMATDLLKNLNALILQEKINKQREKIAEQTEEQRMNYSIRQGLLSLQSFKEHGDKAPRKKYNALHELQRKPEEERR